jgi:hypothetical protein
VDELLSLAATLCAYLLLNWVACFETFSVEFPEQLFFQCNLARRSSAESEWRGGGGKKRRNCFAFGKESLEFKFSQSLREHLRDFDIKKQSRKCRQICYAS